MLADSYKFFTSGAWWAFFFPGVTIMLSVEIEYRGRWSKVDLRASYVWSKSRGNVDIDGGWNSSVEYDFPELSVDRWGWLPNDARHAVKVNGWGALPAGLELGWAAAYFSGFPYSVLRPVSPYGYGFVGGRGAERLPSYRQVDLEGRKHFNLRGTTLTVLVSVLNVFDWESVTEVNEIEGSSGVPLAWQQPRRYEIGMRYAF